MAEIDTSTKAVAKRLERLESLAERGWIDGDVVDLVQALAAERDALAAKLAEVDVALTNAGQYKLVGDDTTLAGRIKWLDDDYQRVHKEKCILWAENFQLKAQRDSALAELAKMKAENEWRPIESAPRNGTEVRVALREFNDPANRYVCCIARFENGVWLDEDDEPIYEPHYWHPLIPPPKESGDE